MGRRTVISSQNNSMISCAAIMFSSLTMCSTWISWSNTKTIIQLLHSIIQLHNNVNQKCNPTRLTRIRAVASWPVSRSLAISLRICLIWSSLLFLNNLILGMLSFSNVLLQQNYSHIVKKKKKIHPSKAQNTKTKIQNSGNEKWKSRKPRSFLFLLNFPNSKSASITIN